MSSPVPEGTLLINTLTERVLDLVHGFVRDQEQVTTLDQPITSSDLTLTVTEPDQLSRGLIEIDNEMLYILDSDGTSTVVTVPPWGRGYSGSVAASHAGGARVTMSPLFPRQRVMTALYECLRESFPDVFAVSQAYIDINPARTNYPLPSDCYQVRQVEWFVPGPTLQWAPVKSWRMNKTPTTEEIEILSRVWPGPQRVRYLYVKNPPTDWGTAGSLQDLGYTSELMDVLIYGASYRLLLATEASRIATQSMVSNSRGEVTPPGSATNAANYLRKLYKERLADERLQLQTRYPLQMHREE
ncbi:phage adaptor protein [Longispora urticae]